MEVATLAQAAHLHAQLIKTARADDDSFPLGNLLAFSALSPAGDLSYARSIFDSLRCPNSFCTNTLLRAYAKHSPRPREALRLFSALRLRSRAPDPDRFTFPFLLAACRRLRDHRHGRELHALVIKGSLASDRFIRNSLVHMYSSCGDMSSARKVFDGMPDRDVVTWTSIIDGAAEGGRPVDALRLFEEMEREGIVDPNDATLVSTLGACAELGALSVGRKVHEVAKRSELDRKDNVATALLDMYAKCGCIDSAREVFDEMPEKDVFAWTAMIAALASHGQCEEALELFHRMRDVERMDPDERTITAVLCACRNVGWVREAYKYFNYWKKHGKGGPKLQHYGCMLDLLARAGYLNEAEEFIKGMPVEPDEILWRTLIWASKVHGDTERAQRLMDEKLLKMDSVDSGSYILSGNVYASAAKWEEKAHVRMMMDMKTHGKPPGWSKIEINGTIHEFVTGDSGHPEAQKIYEKWEEIAEKMKKEGYSPKTSEVLLDLEDEEKAQQLQHHSEKLAVAYGLISLDPGEKIMVIKNLRSCEDCHNAMKFISKIYDREIVIRDRVRFHHFREGKCSCRDFW